MSDVTELLKQVKELLACEERWTKFAGAKSADGHPVMSTAPFAARWCLLGALDKCSGKNTGTWEKTVNLLTDKLPTRFGGDPDQSRLNVIVDTISGFNDDTKITHADLLSFLDKVIAESESESESRAGTGSEARAGTEGEQQ